MFAMMSFKAGCSAIGLEADRLISSAETLVKFDVAAAKVMLAELEWAQSAAGKFLKAIGRG